MQIRIKLPAFDSQVFNKVLIIDNRRFRRFFNLFFEKRFSRGTKDVIEYYYNGSLSMFEETDLLPNSKVIKCYDQNGDLFSTHRIFFSKQGKAFKEYYKILNADGTVLEYSELI